ncbi:MAG TPA: L,D-transpeptidase family protein [Deltaproteobacteria bacterium]|nr:L,D-transpeptidase family protein [Deltaproteobacteria bacterium]
MLMPETGLCSPFEDEVAALIQVKLGSSPPEGGLAVGACQISSALVLSELYQRRGYRPIWLDPAWVEQLLSAIEETYAEGLDPRAYHVEEIRSLQEEILSGLFPDAATTAALDILLTDAFILLAHDLSCGREDPVTHHPQWNLKQQVRGSDPILFLEDALNSPSLTQAARSWRIDHPYYDRLKNALARYRAFRATGGWESVPPGPALKTGMKDPRVASLRRRLAVTDPVGEDPADPEVFDETLEGAVMLFQRRHGLKQDGVAGAGTLEAMNVPLEDRIDQIRVNLERARWVLRGVEETFVLVDIAGFRVFYSKDGRIVFSCRAQVGRPYRDTPVFRSEITHVEINPAWVVPPTIFEQDVLPAVRKNPRYLSKNGLTILDSRGRPVDPSSVDWSRYPGQRFPYTLRQKPGPKNALGRIKIMFPNAYFVYLHDTPYKELFSREDRTFSSGCIRLERPFELAELLLDNPSRWGMDGLMRAKGELRTRTVYLPRPIPILLLYWTVEVDEAGTVYFKKDPYLRDAGVLDGLGRDAGILPVEPPRS